MDRDVLEFAQVMAVLVPSFVICVGAIVGAIRLLRTSPKRDRVPSPLDAEHRERMERLEQAVDAIAVEMERVGESQRFLTRLMAERLPAPASEPQRGRVITPH